MFGGGQGDEIGEAERRGALFQPRSNEGRRDDRRGIEGW